MKCECGCSEEVKSGNRFICGHNRRKQVDNQLIIKMYVKDLYSAGEIAKKLRIGATTVRRILERNAIPRRSLKEAAKVAVAKGKRMAYIVGLMAADGCIAKNRIILNMKDKDLLEQIALTIGEKKVNFRNGYHHLTYYSHQMANDLRNLGIIPRKTFKLAPIRVPALYLSHFVRGFFDGDGCFAFNIRNKNWLAVFTNASESFLNWIHNVVPVRGGINRRRSHNCYELRFGELDSYNLGIFLYGQMSADDICLKRKRLLFRTNKKSS